MKDYHFTARRIILFILIGAPLFSLLLNSYWHFHPQLSQHFYIELPEEYEILDENHDISVFDGSISWLIQIDHAKEFHPEGYSEIPYSPGENSKYYEVQSTLIRLYPEAQELAGQVRILAGGPDGNRFIGIIGTTKIVLYRFWT